MSSWAVKAVYRWPNRVTCKEVSTKQLLRIFAAVFMFAGILAGCRTALLLLILMARFPPLLIAVVPSYWMFSRLKNTADITPS